MAKIGKAQLQQMVEELLVLKNSFDRYKELEKQVKKGLTDTGQDTVEVAGKGRVFISTSTRLRIAPGLARDVLGEEPARKVIQVKESVSNRLLEAFLEVGDIDEGLHAQLVEGADKREVVNLYVRPLK